MRHDFIACLDCSDIWDSSRAVHKSFISLSLSLSLPPSVSLTLTLSLCLLFFFPFSFFLFSPLSLLEENISVALLQEHSRVAWDSVVHAKRDLKRHGFFQDKGLLMPVQP